MQEAIERVFKRALKLKFVVDAETRGAVPTTEVNVAEAALEVF